MKAQILAASLLSAVMLLNAQADNTKKNKRDRAEGAMTAGQQGESEKDIEITRKIRKALTDDANLSTYAKNVKVITRDGRVTLRGPVNSEEEKRSVEKFAVSFAGQANVSNQIEVVKKGKES
jgi:hyperosmotically inducible periplasmic protein